MIKALYEVISTARLTFSTGVSISSSVSTEILTFNTEENYDDFNKKIIKEENIGSGSVTVYRKLIKL